MEVDRERYHPSWRKPSRLWSGPELGCLCTAGWSTCNMCNTHLQSWICVGHYEWVHMVQLQDAYLDYPSMRYAKPLHPSVNGSLCTFLIIRARFLSLVWSKLRLCTANHRAGYFSNLACDWLSIVWAYSEQQTENGPRIPALRSDN